MTTVKEIADAVAEGLSGPSQPFYQGPPEPILQFFSYEHLPPHLANISALFAELAGHIHETLPRNAERTVALRKLLESKDAAVRARLAK